MVEKGPGAGVRAVGVTVVKLSNVLGIEFVKSLRRFRLYHTGPATPSAAEATLGPLKLRPYQHRL